MGFKRITYIACDGPCGTVVKTEKCPVGWSKMSLSLYEILQPNQKPSKRPETSWLCSKCTDRLREVLRREHINICDLDEIEALRKEQAK